MTLTAADEARFRAKYVEQEDGCWQWLRSLDNGYGRFWLDGRTRGAHCVWYEHLVGPVPAGKVLDHLCRNRGCVNPAHLDPKTHGENVLAGVGITAQLARVTHCPQGHPYDTSNTYLTRAGSRQCIACTRARTAAWRRRQPRGYWKAKTA